MRIRSSGTARMRAASFPLADSLSRCGAALMAAEKLKNRRRPTPLGRPLISCGQVEGGQGEGGWRSNSALCSLGTATQGAALRPCLHKGGLLAGHSAHTALHEGLARSLGTAPTLLR